MLSKLVIVVIKVWSWLLLISDCSLIVLHIMVHQEAKRDLVFLRDILHSLASLCIVSVFSFIIRHENSLSFLIIFFELTLFLAFLILKIIYKQVTTNIEILLTLGKERGLFQSSNVMSVFEILLLLFANSTRRFWTVNRVRMLLGVFIKALRHFISILLFLVVILILVFATSFDLVK